MRAAANKQAGSAAAGERHVLQLRLNNSQIGALMAGRRASKRCARLRCNRTC